MILAIRAVLILNESDEEKLTTLSCLRYITQQEQTGNHKAIAIKNNEVGGCLVLFAKDDTPRRSDFGGGPP